MEFHGIIREKYGMKRGAKTHQVTNRAVREEIPGGEETLDALEHFHKLFNSLKSERRGNAPSIQQMVDIVGVMLDRLNGIADEMREAVELQYISQWREQTVWQCTHQHDGLELMRVDGKGYTLSEWDNNQDAQYACRDNVWSRLD